MIVALHLFARDGYEAVSVSQIAGELGMTKGASVSYTHLSVNWGEPIVSCYCKYDKQLQNRRMSKEQ